MNPDIKLNRGLLMSLIQIVSSKYCSRKSIVAATSEFFVFELERNDENDITVQRLI
jgi:hypothetical protein